jgi:hypothetical protein
MIDLLCVVLTLILLTWRIWRAPNNASRWQMGFNWAFEGLDDDLQFINIFSANKFAILFLLTYYTHIKGKGKGKGKGKAVPLQAWSGPEGSRKLRFPDYMTTAQDGCKVVSLTRRPPLPSGNAPDTPVRG